MHMIQNCMTCERQACPTRGFVNGMETKCTDWEAIKVPNEAVNQTHEKTYTKRSICLDCGSYNPATHECDTDFESASIERDAFGLIQHCDNYSKADKVNHPSHYAGNIEVIDYIRDKLTPQGFTEYCCGNVLKYVSRWRKKDGVQDLKKARVYLDWMIESAEKEDGA